MFQLFRHGAQLDATDSLQVNPCAAPELMGLDCGTWHLKFATLGICWEYEVVSGCPLRVL